MSYNIFYLEPTEALMGQERGNRLIRLLKQWWDNMRGGGSFFIVVISKDSKQSFKEVEKKNSKRYKNGYEGNFSALCVIIEVPSSPCTYPLHYTPPFKQPLPHPSSDWSPSLLLLVLGPRWSQLLSYPPSLRICIQVGQWQCANLIGGISIL